MSFILVLCVAIASQVNGSEKKYVSCLKSKMHKEKSAFSDTIINLKYGTAVTIIVTNATSKKDQEKLKWIEVEVDGKKGFVPSYILISKRLFERQSKGKRTMADRAVVSKNKFTEEEEGDMQVMRGAMGGAKSGKANYKVFDKILKATRKAAPTEAELKKFRKQGEIGEFKNKENKL